MSKTLTDTENDNLRMVLTNTLAVPEDVIKTIFSSSKLPFVNKYFLERKDFDFNEKKLHHKLCFSRVGKLTNVELRSTGSVSIIREILGLESKQASEKLNVRKSLTCTVDSSDIESLKKIAVTKDLTVSHLVRAAIKAYLKEIKLK